MLGRGFSKSNKLFIVLIMKNFIQLSRSEMKMVYGGVESVDPVEEGGQNCCAHNADWSVSDCGYSHDEAVAAASYYAQNNPGQHGYYCCTSC